MHHPWILIRQDGLEGSAGWHSRLAVSEFLPKAQDVVRETAAGEDQPAKLGVLLEDALMHPLRITLEEKAPRNELPRFLAWKLKRYLPFSADAAEIRYLPLPEVNTYLTFSLPKAWLDHLASEFDEQHCHCGYIGGAFSTLLENAALFRDRSAIALFDDFYVFARLDRQGNYREFRTRRLPTIGNTDRIDLETLADRDWQPLCRGEDRPPLFCDLRREVDGELLEHLERVGLSLESHHAEGPVLARVQAWLGAKP